MLRPQIWCWKWSYFDWFFMVNLSKKHKKWIWLHKQWKKRTERKQKFSKIKFLKSTFYKILFSPILEDLLQNLDFLHFSSCLLKCLPMCPSIKSFCHKVDREQEELINQTLSIFASVTHASMIGKPLSRDQRSRRHVQKGWKPIQRNRCWKTFPLMTTIPSAIVARFVKQKEKNCRHRYTNT